MKSDTATIGPAASDRILVTAGDPGGSPGCSRFHRSTDRASAPQLRIGSRRPQLDADPIVIGELAWALRAARLAVPENSIAAPGPEVPGGRAPAIEPGDDPFARLPRAGEAGW